jgi:hypothetical protein
MMNKQRWFVITVISIIMIILTACGSSATPTQEPVATNPPPIDTPQAAAPTAAPQSTEETASDSAQAAYPAPTIEYVDYNPYPAPVEGEMLDWVKIPEILASGNVSEVFQQATLLVVITMKDGSTAATNAPAKDEIFKLLDQCGEKCNGIRRVTEW